MGCCKCGTVGPGLGLTDGCSIVTLEGEVEVLPIEGELGPAEGSIVVGVCTKDGDAVCSSKGALEGRELGSCVSNDVGFIDGASMAGELEVGPKVGWMEFSMGE